MFLEQDSGNQKNWVNLIMGAGMTHTSIRRGILLPGLLLCLVSVDCLAGESNAPAWVLANETLGLMSADNKVSQADTTPFPLAIDQDAGLDFDLGGSETRKLQLRLDQPLALSTTSNARVLDNGGNLLGLDATLNVPVSDTFSIAAGVTRQVGKARFQSLGSIQCMNGTLRADSYTASGCRFIDEPIASTDRQRINLGASMNFSNAAASINWFTQDAELNQSGVNRLNQFGGQPTMGSSLLSPNLGNPLMAPTGFDPLHYLNSEASGIDLNFKVGIATDTRGDIRVGLAFTRVLEADYKGLYSGFSDSLSWTLAEPFNSARMNLEWSQGSFSSGIQGFYRDSVDFLNRSSVDSLTTFDVHFTWRTPWNANLSVGASNVLNAGSDNSANTESQQVDPFESIYGRIPYVRYKQDL
jgi:hypothetical protein